MNELYFFRPKTKPDLPKLDIDKAKQNQEQESKVSVKIRILIRNSRNFQGILKVFRIRRFFFWGGEFFIVKIRIRNS